VKELPVSIGYEGVAEFVWNVTHGPAAVTEPISFGVQTRCSRPF
jgi:hypothetical protein